MRAAWPLVEPGKAFRENWHHELIAEHLELAAKGEIRRLVINVPPRTTKSREVSVMWPCWLWARLPERSFIFSSYSGGLAVTHSLERRTILASDWYQKRWGHRVEFASDQNLKTEFQNTKRGTMLATSTGGSVMGRGGDIIVVDDPHNPEQVLSDAERASQLRYFDQQLSGRFNEPKEGVLVIIMQRLHQQDLTGHVLEEGGWVHISLPQDPPEPQRIVFPVSGRVIERKPGDLLWPDRYPAAELEAQKIRLGSWAYAGQHQQAPTPLGGGIFKRDWWHFWTAKGNACPTCGAVHGLPAQFDQMLQSWDCAFKELRDTDFVVGQVWGAKGASAFLRDQVRARMSFTGTLSAIATLSAKWPRALAKLIEDKANGPAVIDTLRQKIAGLIAVEPEGGKIARAQAVSPAVEAGNVFLPHPLEASWVHDFVEEHAAFPGGAHDDQVDGTSQALHRMNLQPGKGIRDYTREEMEKAAKQPKAKQAHGAGRAEEPPSSCAQCGAGSNLIRQTGTDPIAFACMQCGKDPRAAEEAQE